MDRLKHLVLFIVTTVIIAACGGQVTPATASVSGTIIVPESAVLPEDAVIEVQIQDSSLADVKAIVIGEQTITNPEQSPIPFEVAYDPDQIQDNHTYTMRVRITDSNDNLLFINDTAIPVITRGSPTENFEIPVIQVGG
jgi:putative lipoprotein